MILSNTIVRSVNCPPYWVEICIAGDIGDIRRICREHVVVGLGVTVTPTNYIYPGCEETGAIIRLIHYARPDTNNDIDKEAAALTTKLIFGCQQASATIMSPQYSIWQSRRESA
jgi:hypothetical protein